RFRYPSAPAFAAVSELPAQALIDLVRSRQFEELESAWQRAAEAPGPVDAYCGVVEALCDADMASRALGLAANMVEALARLGRAGEARRLAATTGRRGAHNEAMARRLLELTEQVFASEPWYPLLKERSQLGSSLSADTFEAFESLLRYTAGHVVYHRGGWGEGVVERIDPERGEVGVRFASGRTM